MTDLREWRWMSRLIKDGHRFKGGEWRCVDCRRTVFDMLEHRQPCMSPSIDGDYLFLGGPLDGQWVRMPLLSPKTFPVTIPPAAAIHPMEEEDSTYDTISYVLKRKEGPKPILAYVFEG